MALNINGTTGISGVDGTVSAPALTGTDSNTGITFPAADTIKFSTGGVERMSITNSGVVGGGKILQVVGATTNNEASTTSTTMADTGLTASITPSATDSKVLVLIQMPYMFIRSSGSKSAAGFNVVRDSSNDIFRSYYNTGESEYHFPYFEYNNNITSMTIRGMLNWSILDSPSTTSSMAYKVQFARGMSTAVYINPYNNGSYRPFSSINLLEVGA